MKETAQEILDFWFREITDREWYAKDDSLDDMIRKRFLHHHQLAERGELSEWRSTAHGRLAEILLLDQFTRNIYRGTSNAFRNDMMALTLAQELVMLGLDRQLNDLERQFAYMPYMHSESRRVHQDAVTLFKKLGDEGSLKYEYLHKDIIDKFGRFPHRNKVLGRSTTPKENEFLKKHSGF